MIRVLHRVGSAGALSLALLLGASAVQARAAEGGHRAAQDQLAQDDDAAPSADGAVDGSAMVVRVSRLEAQIRTLTGQIEQLQYQNKRLEDDLRKMQGDVDFRFQDLQRQGAPSVARPVPQKRSEAGPAAGDQQAAAPPPVPDEAPALPAPPRPRIRSTGDAFDPDGNPSAPGAPRLLGTTTPSQPLAPRTTTRTVAVDQNAPLDLMQRPSSAPADGDAPPDPAVIPAPPPARDPNSVASLIPGGTREEYEANLALYKQGQFDGAATGFQGFAAKYPRDRLVPDAFYLAGESYARLGRHREAAEQFLKVSTDYAKSPRAPDALLRLGVSLNALGAKDQACATYLEVNRRYPAASADVRSGVDRELKRAHCAGNG